MNEKCQLSGKFCQKLRSIVQKIPKLFNHVQKNSELKVKIIHDVKEGLSFLLRGRDFL